MIDIAEEMKAAHKQYLQDEWDRWLITGWKNGNVIMWNCVKGFIAKYNITFDQLNELERTPKYKRHSVCMLTRYIAAYLPTLNTMLWNGTASDELMLHAMKGMKALTNPFDAGKCSRERSKRDYARRAATAETISNSLVADQRRLTSPSNWKHCK